MCPAPDETSGVQAAASASRHSSWTDRVVSKCPSGVNLPRGQETQTTAAIPCHKRGNVLEKAMKGERGAVPSGHAAGGRWGLRETEDGSGKQRRWRGRHVGNRVDGVPEWPWREPGASSVGSRGDRAGIQDA